MANLNYNHIVLGGRLATEPELKTTQSGTTVCGFTIAVANRWSKTEERQTDFYRCRAFGKTAEFIAQYFRKGSSILIDGSIHNDNWVDQQGIKHYGCEVRVSDATFVDSRSDSQAASQAEAPQSPPDRWASAPSPAEMMPEPIDSDDLPF